MKKLLIAATVLLATSANAQCLNVIGQKKDNAIALFKQVDSLFGLHFVEKLYSHGQESLMTPMDNDTLQYVINFYSKVSDDDYGNTYYADSVRRIGISGRPRMVKKIFNLLVYPQIQPCIEEHAGYWYFYNHTILIYDSTSNYITMEYKDSMSAVNPNNRFQQTPAPAPNTKQKSKSILNRVKSATQLIPQ